jgi:hypothetical protein
MTTRHRLPVRIRNKRNTANDFEARIAPADRIADLPGIEIIERRNDASVPETVALTTSTREWPKFSRTSLQ